MSEAARPRVEVRAAESIRLREYAIRFAFGAAVALVAVLAGKLGGPSIGGLFLAFPAILPATLTLIEKKEGRRRAQEDDMGAVAGGLGLIAFAVAGGLAVSRLGLPGPAALAAATAAWLVLSVGALLVAFGLRALVTRRTG